MKPSVLQLYSICGEHSHPGFHEPSPLQCMPAASLSMACHAVLQQARGAIDVQSLTRSPKALLYFARMHNAVCVVVD